MCRGAHSAISVCHVYSAVPAQPGMFLCGTRARREQLPPRAPHPLLQSRAAFCDPRTARSASLTHTASGPTGAEHILRVPFMPQKGTRRYDIFSISRHARAPFSCPVCRAEPVSRRLCASFLFFPSLSSAKAGLSLRYKKPDASRSPGSRPALSSAPWRMIGMSFVTSLRQRSRSCPGPRYRRNPRRRCRSGSQRCNRSRSRSRT